jgi:hypothetical protein
VRAECELSPQVEQAWPASWPCLVARTQAWLRGKASELGVLTVTAGVLLAAGDPVKVPAELLVGLFRDRALIRAPE